MPHDPARVADTKAWMTRADADIGAGVYDLATELPFTGDAVFHAQQGAEKAFKAFLVWHGVAFGDTGDIGVLGRLCARIDEGLAFVGRRAARLTDYAWKYRYPGEPEEPSEEEAEAAIDLAAEVYDAVKSRLPPEACPPGPLVGQGDGTGLSTDR